MSDFLERWDAACSLAREVGAPVVLLKQAATSATAMCVAARTMHPSFMAVPTPKHDPERDQ